MNKDKVDKLTGLLDECRAIVTAIEEVDKPKPAPCRDYARCQRGAKTDVQPCCGCAEYEPDVDPKPAPCVDPVSGLTPRFTPKTELPKGAVLFYQRWNIPDWYWAPSGNPWWVAPDGTTGATYRFSELSYELCSAARALGLPLAGEDLAEGEEFYAHERHQRLFTDRPDPNISTDRRWDKGEVHGWICKKIVKPAPVAPSKNDASDVKEQRGEDVKARLEALGATVDDGVCHEATGLRMTIHGDDGKCDFHAYDLDERRAEAALLAAQMKCGGDRCEALGSVQQQLAAANAEVGRLEGLRNLAYDLLENHDLYTGVAWKRKAAEWLARNR